MKGKRKVVTYTDFVCDPTPTMILLAELKNDGRSWRGVAEELNNQFSHSLLRKVALGICKSDGVSIALGIKPIPKVVEVEPCTLCGEVHTQKTCAHSRPKQPRFRVALEFETKTEQREMITILAEYGANRIEQSSNLKQRIKQ